MSRVGDIVRCKQTKGVAWVARGKDPTGRWLLITKGVDDRGRSTLFGRRAGEGDLQVVTPAPTYAVGATVEHNGLSHVVLENQGDFVELGVPDTTSPLARGGALHTPAGNVITVPKSDIVFNTLTNRERN